MPVPVVMIVIPGSLNYIAFKVHVNNVNNVVVEGSSCGDHSRPAWAVGQGLVELKSCFGCCGRRIDSQLVFWRCYNGRALETNAPIFKKERPSYAKSNRYHIYL